MKASIIAIGDELLIGQVIDTNSSYIARKLTQIHISVENTIKIGDEKEPLIRALDQSEEIADLVIITGGLGPTKDDKTKKLLCDRFETELVFSQEAYDHIISLFKGDMSRMNYLNKEQAMVPAKARVIVNQRGTAPILWLEKEGKTVIALPGVPQEMQWCIDHEIIPRLEQREGREEIILHRHYCVKDYPESRLAIVLEDFENSLPSFIKMAYLPQLGWLKLRFSATHSNRSLLEKELADIDLQLHQLLQHSIFAQEDSPIEQMIARKLIEKNYTLSTAESCTAGTIAQRMAAYGGASAYFSGSIVAYSNQIKEQILHIQIETLQKWGAVSEQTVIEMAQNCRQIMQTDVAVAVSGIAGPTGGTAEKPVGTVWIAVATPEKTTTYLMNGWTERAHNIEKATQQALLLLYLSL